MLATKAILLTQSAIITDEWVNYEIREMFIDYQ